MGHPCGGTRGSRPFRPPPFRFAQGWGTRIRAIPEQDRRGGHVDPDEDRPAQRARQTTAIHTAFFSALTPFVAQRKPGACDPRPEGARALPGFSNPGQPSTHILARRANEGPRQSWPVRHGVPDLLPEAGRRQAGFVRPAGRESKSARPPGLESPGNGRAPSGRRTHAIGMSPASHQDAKALESKAIPRPGRCLQQWSADPTTPRRYRGRPHAVKDALSRCTRVT